MTGVLHFNQLEYYNRLFQKQESNSVRLFRPLKWLQVARRKLTIHVDI
jgi:hypothetical protein